MCDSEKCNCDFCQLSNKAHQTMANRNPDEMVAFIRELMDRLINVEFDRDYYQSIVKGSWPSAEEILRKTLAEIEAKKTREKTLVCGWHNLQPECVGSTLDQLALWGIKVLREYDYARACEAHRVLLFDRQNRCLVLKDRHGTAPRILSAEEAKQFLK